MKSANRICIQDSTRPAKKVPSRVSSKSRPFTWGHFAFRVPRSDADNKFVLFAHGSQLCFPVQKHSYLYTLTKRTMKREQIHESTHAFG